MLRSIVQNRMAVWHNHGAMPRRLTPPPPLDAAALERLALRYVERYATTRAKLAAYLARKLRERGSADAMPDIEGLVERFANLGYVDDRAFGEMRAAAMEGDLPWIERLLARGVAPDEPDATGWTPLHWAASNDRREAATALMRGGAEIDKRCALWHNRTLS